MPTVAVIEDDVPTSNQLKGWIEAARPGIHVHQWFDRDSAERAVAADEGVSEATRSAIIEIHETLAALKEAIED